MIYLFIKQYYKSIIIGLLILWLSLSGSKSMVSGRLLDIPYYDKLGHFTMYTFFSAMLLLDSCKWSAERRFRYITLLIPLFYGILIEVMQMTLTSSRKGELLDLGANITGVATGILLARIVLIVFDRLRS